MVDFPATISINGNIFVHQEMLPAHNHVLYVCKETMQQVKVRWREIMEMYEVEGGSRKGEMHPYCIYTHTLQEDLKMKGKLIDNYFPVSEHRSDIGAFIEAMRPIDEKIRARKYTG